MDQIVHKIHFNAYFFNQNKLPFRHYHTIFSYLTMLLILKDVERYLYSFYEEKNDAFSNCFHTFLKKIPNDLLEMWNQQTNLGPHPRRQTPRRNEREKLHRAVKFNLQITQFIQINPFVGEQTSKQISSTAFLNNKGLST